MPVDNDPRLSSTQKTNLTRPAIEPKNGLVKKLKTQSSHEVKSVDIRALAHGVDGPVNLPRGTALPSMNPLRLTSPLTPDSNALLGPPNRSGLEKAAKPPAQQREGVADRNALNLVLLKDQESPSNRSSGSLTPSTAASSGLSTRSHNGVPNAAVRKNPLKHSSPFIRQAPPLTAYYELKSNQSKPEQKVDVARFGDTGVFLLDTSDEEEMKRLEENDRYLSKLPLLEPGVNELSDATLDHQTLPTFTSDGQANRLDQLRRLPSLSDEEIQAELQDAKLQKKIMQLIKRVQHGLPSKAYALDAIDPTLEQTRYPQPPNDTGPFRAPSPYDENGQKIPLLEEANEHKPVINPSEKMPQMAQSPGQTRAPQRSPLRPSAPEKPVASTASPARSGAPNTISRKPMAGSETTPSRTATLQTASLNNRAVRAQQSSRANIANRTASRTPSSTNRITTQPRTLPLLSGPARRGAGAASPSRFGAPIPTSKKPVGSSRATPSNTNTLQTASLIGRPVQAQQSSRANIANRTASRTPSSTNRITTQPRTLPLLAGPAARRGAGAASPSRFGAPNTTSKKAVESSRATPSNTTTIQTASLIDRPVRTRQIHKPALVSSIVRSSPQPATLPTKPASPTAGTSSLRQPVSNRPLAPSAQTIPAGSSAIQTPSRTSRVAQARQTPASVSVGRNRRP